MPIDQHHTGYAGRMLRWLLDNRAQLPLIGAQGRAYVSGGTSLGRWRSG